MPIYNKLVRDNIPAIIEKAGKTAKTRFLDDAEYIEALRTKTKEELTEYLEATNDQDALEELADVMELIKALAIRHGASLEEVEAIRKQKAEKRGGFLKKVFLIEVQD